MTANDDPLHDRIGLLLTHAVAALDPADRAERIAWCQANDAHGIRMHPGDDGILEFRWGGRRLALVAAADLLPPAPCWPPTSWPTRRPTPCPAIDRPVSTPINRPLTDDERQLLLRLAVDVVAGQLGCHPEAAAAALDGMAVTLRGDATDVCLDADGRQIDTTRDRLAWHATGTALTRPPTSARSSRDVAAALLYACPRARYPRRRRKHQGMPPGHAGRHATQANTPVHSRCPL